MTNTIHAHPELWPPYREPCDDDQRWFMDHPDALVRLRPQFPDELETLDAITQVAGGGPFARIDCFVGTRDLPNDCMVVVDVLRLQGIPAGPGGASTRARIACPTPVHPAMADAIAYRAVETVTRAIAIDLGHRNRKRSAPKGFS